MSLTYSKLFSSIIRYKDNKYSNEIQNYLTFINTFKLMSDIIQEISNSIAKDFIMEHKSSINNDAPLTHECVQYAIERIFAMSLSERMTAQEKERVRKMYKRMVRDVENSDSYDCIPASDMDNVMETLESIFGSDFFKEEE